jgi:CheY-like chemotaxis protein
MFNLHSYLYVEDDVMSREILSMIMGVAMGVERLHLFPDSVDFAARLDALPDVPKLILLDIHMKPIDGFAMLRLIRERRAFDDSIVLALTASVMNEEVARLRSSGFNGAIAKPLSVSTFPDLIARVLSGESVWHIA